MKKILVTGASDGIGKVTARELAARGHHVVIVGRNTAKTASVADEISRTAKSGKVDLMIADLARPAAVKALAHEYSGKYGQLDILVNNAGAFFADFIKTPDGFEQTFALNHLNYFYLTELLLPLISQSNAGRIVNVASEAHRGCEIDFDNLNGEKGPSAYNGWRAYQRSKLANILFTRELARRLLGTRVTANVLHPGFVASKFGHNNGGIWGPLVKFSQLLFAINEDRGAATSIFLADDASVATVTGKYFDKCRERAPTNAAMDDASARRLWDVTDQLLKPFR
jgi:NAD(P)-dependent dehydrogenase (short-subunit alcohol dehydrogenase family)